MTPQFEMVAEQERVDPRKPPDTVMAAHVMDNMQSLMFGTESLLSSPTNNFMETSSIMPVEKFALDQLQPNESPIPPDHDCDKCVVDATACTLLQAANENSNFMDRLNTVSFLRKTVPGFDSLPNEEVNALIKDGMAVMKTKRLEMQSNTPVVDTAGGEQIASPVEQTDVPAIAPSLEQPKITPQQSQPEMKVFNSTKADVSPVVTGVQEQPISLIKPPTPASEVVQEPITVQPHESKLKTTPLERDRPIKTSNLQTDTTTPETVRTNTVSTTTELPKATAPSEAPAIIPRIIIDRNQRPQAETKNTTHAEVPKIGIVEIRNEIHNPKPEGTIKTIDVSPVRVDSPAGNPQSEATSSSENLQKQKQSATVVEKLSSGEQSVAEPDFQEMGQGFYFNQENDETSYEVVTATDENNEVTHERPIDLSQIEEISEIVAPSVDTHNVFTYQTETETLGEELVVTHEVPEQIVEDVEMVEENPEIMDQTITFQPESIISQLDIAETTEPTSIDYIFDSTDNFAPVEELPIIQPELILPQDTEIIVERLAAPEKIDIVEMIQTDLQPLEDLAEGIVLEVVDLDPVMQMIYQYETPKDIQLIPPQEPELIISKIHAIHDTENIVEENKEVIEVFSEESHSPEEVVETLEQIEKVIDELTTVETDSEKNQIEWVTFVEQDPILKDVSEMLASILLEIVLINNPEISDEVYTAKTVADSSLLYRYLSQKAAQEETQNNNNKRNPAQATYKDIMLLVWSYANVLSNYIPQTARTA